MDHALLADADVGRARPLLSICIPAYNRAQYLRPLLESIAQQDFHDLEIVISEDQSPERAQIRHIVEDFAAGYRDPLRYSEVESNLGYDGNIRRLIALAAGRYCFFMGNDDLLVPGALRLAAAHLARHPDVGMLLRGYAWFRGSPDHVTGTVRYVQAPTRLAPGREAITMCFRRSGVLSGYVIERDPAHAAATDRFDGTLYYQMHLTASVLSTRAAVVVPDVLVLCRDQVAPDFGAAPREQGYFTPGGYTPEARAHMLRGAMAILQAHQELATDGTREHVERDYARHFYPFVMDQLGLPPRAYLRLCRAMAQTPVGRYPSFYVNCLLAYLLGRRRTDTLLLRLRGWLGRTPRL